MRSNKQICSTVGKTTFLDFVRQKSKPVSSTRCPRKEKKNPNFFQSKLVSNPRLKTLNPSTSDELKQILKKNAGDGEGHFIQQQPPKSNQGTKSNHLAKEELRL